MKIKYYKIAFLLSSILLGIFAVSCDCEEEEDDQNEPQTTVTVQRQSDLDTKRK